jgi:hypothetical protein
VLVPQPSSIQQENLDSTTDMLIWPIYCANVKLQSCQETINRHPTCA